jgi:TetR/AcrR family transcriptional regulator, regulator of cefoperazone and chloramphenicol sensitivity
MPSPRPRAIPTPAAPSAPTAGDATRERLIQAAGREFARRGFEDASVRAICTAAGANISAVKYHFGGKEALYRAVIDTGRSQMCGGVAPPVMSDADEPTIALERWLTWFLRMILLNETNHPWIGEIMAHEAMRPTACLDDFVEHTAGPVRLELVRIVRRLLPPRTHEQTAQRLANAVIGMCVAQKHGREMFKRFGYPPPREPGEIENLAKLFARFAIHGLRHFTPSERPSRKSS